MVIILDGNGFIAGIQTVVMIMKDLATDDVYDFTNSPYYVPGYWLNGEEAYFVTAYFVNTSGVQFNRHVEYWVQIWDQFWD